MTLYPCQDCEATFTRANMLSRHRFEAHRARFCRWCRYSSSCMYLISRHLQRAHPSIHPVQGERIWRLRDAPIEPTQRMNPVAEPLRELQNVYNPSMVEVRIPYSPAPTVDTHTTYVPTRKVTCTKSSLLGYASPAVSEWEQGGDDFTLGEEDTSDSVSKGVDGGDGSGVFPAVQDRVWETAMESTRGSGVALVPPFNWTCLLHLMTFVRSALLLLFHAIKVSLAVRNHRTLPCRQLALLCLPLLARIPSLGGLLVILLFCRWALRMAPEHVPPAMMFCHKQTLLTPAAVAAVHV